MALQARPIVGEICSATQAQALALEAAVGGAGFVSPNPLVGCAIISRDGRLLSTGYHSRFGSAHAEVDAIQKVESQYLEGATLYVTLEPCSHHGKTPPCADRIIKERFEKVVIGALDPNPLVAGKGLEKLKRAGIITEFDENFTKKSKKLAEHFLWNMEQQRPFVTLKLAMSLDGKMALPNGESQWLTSEASRRLGRVLRAHHDATMVGAQTLLQDNPILDFRDTLFEGKKENKIIIWDPKHKTKDTLVGSRLEKTHSRNNIFVIERIDDLALQKLYQQGIKSLYVEGGAKTISAFVEKKLFNKIYVFVAPLILGNGSSWTSGLSLESMKDRLSLEFENIIECSGDFLITAYPKL